MSHLMLGVNSQPRMVGENRIEPIEAFGLKVISVGFLNPGDKPVIWRGPMLPQIIRQFLGLVEWGTRLYGCRSSSRTGAVALSLGTVPPPGPLCFDAVGFLDAARPSKCFGR